MNINYTIAENNEATEPFDITKYEFDCYNNEDDLYNSDELYFLYTSYNVRRLTQILNYYGINKKKMVKDEMIQSLILFECDIINMDIVFRRRRLWENIEELSLDAYFKPFILYTV